MENTLTIPGKMTKTSHLNLVSGEKNCKIPTCAGGSKASLRYAYKTFREGIDVRFEEYKLDTVQPATAEIEAEVWKMGKRNGNFVEIFNSFNVDIKHLKWDSQEQIKKFCIENKSWIPESGNLNPFLHFLFSEKINKKEEFFVAYTYSYNDKGTDCRLLVRKISVDQHCNAKNKDLFVVPATWRLGLK